MSGADRAWVACWGCLAISAGLDGIPSFVAYVAAVWFLLLVFIAEYVDKKGKS